MNVSGSDSIFLPVQTWGPLFLSSKMAYELATRDLCFFPPWEMFWQFTMACSLQMPMRGKIWNRPQRQLALVLAADCATWVPWGDVGCLQPSEEGWEETTPLPLSGPTLQKREVCLWVPMTSPLIRISLGSWFWKKSVNKPESGLRGFVGAMRTICTASTGRARHKASWALAF